MENKDKETYIEKKYQEFIKKMRYLPKMFNPYNSKEILDYAPTITTQCGSIASSSTILIVEGIET